MTTQRDQPWHEKIFSGDWVTGGAAPITVTTKATGAELTTVGQATPADLDVATDRAREAQREWAALPYTRRAEVMHRAARLLEEEPDRLLPWLVAEAGSARGKADFEIALVRSELQESAALASAPYGEVLRSSKPRLSLARHVPHGVVGVISPFNFPAILSMRSVAPALALGNAVVLKPDPRTPVSGGLALAELFADAGLPGGLLHVLPGGPDLGAALVGHADVPCISFTGSTEAGRSIGQTAAGLFKEVHLELGGNNALLVLPDADVEAAAGAGAWGSFLHQGQICMTSGRHLVHTSMADRYGELLAEKAAAIPVGDPEDAANLLGPLIDERQRDRVHELVRAAVDDGARLLAGGTFDGLYYRPTALRDVPRTSRAFTEEIFGPVAPITTYDTVDEAIDIINASEHGLSTGVLTSDPFAGLELAERIESGLVHINDQTVDDEAVIPFGGIKASGTGGRFGGANANLDTFCRLQWVTVQSEIERYPF